VVVVLLDVIAAALLLYADRSAVQRSMMYARRTVSVVDCSSSSSNNISLCIALLQHFQPCANVEILTPLLSDHRQYCHYCIAITYRFNRIGPFVDKLCQFLQPHSDENRMTLYKTVLCYYDGVQELFEYAKCECAITFANVGKVSNCLNIYNTVYLLLLIDVCCCAAH
jgi:hypothetical protein